MPHWAESYVGRPYDDERADCAILVRDVLRDHFGVHVDLPSDRDWRRKEPQEVADLGRSAADRIEPDEAREGDLVLMRIVGDRRTLGSHIGVLTLINGQEWVLHAIKQMGSLLTPVRHLGAFQLELTGYYRAKDHHSEADQSR